jgi:hypothetical protein
VYGAVETSGGEEMIDGDLSFDFRMESRNGKPVRLKGFIAADFVDSDPRGAVKHLIGLIEKQIEGAVSPGVEAKANVCAKTGQPCIYNSNCTCPACLRHKREAEDSMRGED